jgi:hypothetical protein
MSPLSRTLIAKVLARNVLESAQQSKFAGVVVLLGLFEKVQMGGVWWIHRGSGRENGKGRFGPRIVGASRTTNGPGCMHGLGPFFVARQILPLSMDT